MQLAVPRFQFRFVPALGNVIHPGNFHPVGAQVGAEALVDRVLAATPEQPVAGSGGNWLLVGGSGGFGSAARAVLGAGHGAHTLNLSFDAAPQPDSSNKQRKIGSAHLLAVLGGTQHDECGQYIPLRGAARQRAHHLAHRGALQRIWLDQAQDGGAEIAHTLALGALQHLAAQQVQRLDACGAFVQRGDAGITRDLLHAVCVGRAMRRFWGVLPQLGKLKQFVSASLRLLAQSTLRLTTNRGKMNLGKKVVIASAMLFPSHTAFAALVVGPPCVTPTSVKIEGRYYTQNITKAVVSALVPGYPVDQFANQWGFDGYAFNCPKTSQSVEFNKTQWVTFLMKGTNYFAAGNSSDHAVVIARGGKFAPTYYQGIGAIFSQSYKYGAKGEYFTNLPNATLANGCQDVKSNTTGYYPETYTFSAAACNGGNPNNVSLADNTYYRVTIHAGGAGMGYTVTDTLTGSQIALGYIESQKQSGTRPNLFANGGLSFWALWNNLIAQPGSSVEYSEIASGWF